MLWVRGVLAERPGAHLQSLCVVALSFGWWSCSSWGISLFLTIFLAFSFCFFFPHRERLQHCPVLEWLQGKPNVSLAFSSFCAVCPSNPSTSFMSFFIFDLTSRMFHLQFLVCLLSHFTFPLSFFVFFYSLFLISSHYLSPAPTLYLVPLLALFSFPCVLLLPLSCRLFIPTGRGYSPLTWPLRP